MFFYMLSLTLKLQYSENKTIIIQYVTMQVDLTITFPGVPKIDNIEFLEYFALNPESYGRYRIL